MHHVLRLLVAIELMEFSHYYKDHPYFREMLEKADSFPSFPFSPPTKGILILRKFISIINKFRSFWQQL